MTELDKDALDAAARAIAGGGSLRDAIRAYLDAADDWRPMETAPRERFINLYCPDDKSIWWAKWQGGEWYGIDDHGLTRRGHSAGDPQQRHGVGGCEMASSPLPAEGGRMMLTEAEWRNIDEFRRHWHDFCDCDAFEGCDTFADRMESSGFIELVPVDADAVESSFAEERGIVPGGMMWTLTPAGRAALEGE